MINVPERKILETMWLTSIAPKMFLFRYPLKLGATIVGLLMCSILMVCVISITVEIVQYTKLDSCGYKMAHNAYAFSINAMIYCIIMVFVNLWYVWGVKHQKSSVVLCWVVITMMWWLQSFFFVSVLIFLYSQEVSLVSWILALVFGVLAFVLLLYGILVGFGYWLELKGVRGNADAS